MRVLVLNALQHRWYPLQAFTLRNNRLVNLDVTGYPGYRAGTSGGVTGEVNVTVQYVVKPSEAPDESDHHEPSDHHETDTQKALARSTWLRHIMVAADGWSDPEGIVTRPVKGLGGVDYLGTGKLMEATTWVFGPTIKHLLQHGYTQRNLRAAPYDWRIPPSKMEERDGYFSGLVHQIERIYADNANRPVVLLGHSMGCKILHYFACWVVENPPAGAPVEGDGRSWLDKYLHGLLPVGGPFLGARKSYRAILSGDDMGLAQFMNDDETLTLSRGLAGSCLLLPEGPLKRSPSFDPVYVKQEGVLMLEIVDAVFEDVGLQNLLAVGNEHLYIKVISTRHQKRHLVAERVKKLAKQPVRGGYNAKQPIGFRCQFTTVTRYLSDQKSDEFTFELHHRKSNEVLGPRGSSGRDGLPSSPMAATNRTRANSAKKVKPIIGVLTIRLRDIFSSRSRLHRNVSSIESQEKLCVLELARSLHASVDVRDRRSNLALHPNVFVAAEAVECLRLWLHTQGRPSGEAEAVVELQRLIDFGMCSPCDGNTNGNLTGVRFFMFNEDALDGCEEDGHEKRNESWVHDRQMFGGGASRAERTLKLKSHGKDVVSLTVRAVFEPVSARFETQDEIVHGDERLYAETHYDAMPMMQTLARNGAGDTVHWRKEYLLNDPAYLKGNTVLEAPPVKRCLHVYGVDLKTEWAFMYRAKNAVEVKARGPRSLCVELDGDAKIRDKNFDIDGGIVYETPNTKQQLVDAPEETVRRSGDGTVPYQSLRYSKSWESETCLSQVVEVPGAEHRDILNDQRLHTILSEYLAQTVSIYVLEAADLPAMDSLASIAAARALEAEHGHPSGGACDPYVRVVLVSEEPRFSKTKVVHQSLNPIWNEAFTFGGLNNLHGATGILLEVWDWDRGVSNDDYIGQVCTCLSSVLASLGETFTRGALLT
jgi:hypothetical protein